MRSKVVTVFGGSGFIGRYVVQRLAEHGAVIRVPTRTPGAGAVPEAAGRRRPDRSSSPGTRRPRARSSACSSAPIAVVSLIGILFESRERRLRPAPGASLPGEIGAAAAAAGRRARGPCLRDRGRSGLAVPPTRRTKAAGEAALRASFPQATILRPSIVFGPEDGFFNRFARMSQLLAGAAADRRRPDALPAGLCRRCRGRRGGGAAPARRRAGQTFELGGPPIYSFKELLTYLLQVTGRRRAAREPAVRPRQPSGEAARVPARAAADAGSGRAAEERQRGRAGCGRTGADSASRRRRSR